jgi:hypothetical protein
VGVIEHDSLELLLVDLFLLISDLLKLALSFYKKRLNPLIELTNFIHVVALVDINVGLVILKYLLISGQLLQLSDPLFKAFNH